MGVDLGKFLGTCRLFLGRKVADADIEIQRSQIFADDEELTRAKAQDTNKSLSLKKIKFRLYHSR